jgi:hypothetical protein
MSKTREQRFWAKVEKTDDCWNWMGWVEKEGAPGEGGHGKFGWGRDEGNEGAHRASWRLNVGTIPAGMSVLHRCDNRRCVRPDHLFLGTHADNMEDMARKGRAATGDAHGMRKHPERRPRGERHGNARLDAEKVRDMRSRHEAGESQSSLARAFEVHPVTVFDVVRRRTWGHL